MKKHLILCVVACAAAACTHTPKAGQQQPAAAEVAEKTQTLCGGYTAQRPLTEDEHLLFDRVTRELTGVKYTPQSVATQVVAGTNYRFVCTAETATDKPAVHKAEITVYQPLPGQGGPKITEIRKL